MASLDLPPFILALFLLPFGLVIGSFCNVLIHRLPMEAPEDRNVVTTPSHCPSCKARIKAWHNLPLVGWLALRGRCAACGWRIPVRYPLVELLGGLILAGSVYVFPVGTLIWFKGVICGFALLVLFFTDFTEFILPDVLQFPLMALGLAFVVPQMLWPDATLKILMPDGALAVVETFRNGLQQAPGWLMVGDSVTWRDSLIGLVAGYGVPWALATGYVLFNNTILVRVARKERIEEAMGMGDFKMLAWIGAFWGWQVMLGVLGLAVITMGSVALVLLLLRRVKGASLLPLGCALSVATPVAVFWGRALWEGYLGMSGMR